MPRFLQNTMNTFYFKLHLLALKVSYQTLKDSVKGGTMGKHLAKPTQYLCTFLRSALAL